MRARNLTCLLLFGAATCTESPKPSSGRIDSLLASTDSVAIYDAGVEAYRAKDYAAARRLWSRGIELNVPHTRSNLGYLLYYGLGGSADSTTATRLWREAMDEGDAEAHRHIAQAILDGNAKLGTLTDAYGHAIAARMLAARPDELAGDAIVREAEQLAAKIGEGLSAVDRARAEQLARQWVRETSTR